MHSVLHPRSVSGKIHLQLKGLLTITIAGDGLSIIQLRVTNSVTLVQNESPMQIAYIYYLHSLCQTGVFVRI